MKCIEGSKECILETLKNQSESWKSSGNLFLKKGTNPVKYSSFDLELI